MKVIILTLLTIVLLPYYVMAQDGSTYTPYQQDRAEASPSAANMANLDTDLYTGRINITVPMYTVTEGSLSLPINLQYKTTGIPVDELPSWVGLGWNLNAGGVIVRTVKGLRDEAKYPAVEATPDEFDFNFLGQSGTFVVGGDWTGVTNRKIKIESSINPLQSSGSSTIDYIFSYWKITLENGTQCYFRYIEYTTYSGGGTNIPSGWYLTEVISADGNDRIYLEYTTSALEVNTLYFRDEIYVVTKPQNHNSVQSYSQKEGSLTVSPTYLTRIITTNQSISFNTSYDATYKRTKLMSIDVNKKDGTLVKDIALSYKAYGSTRYFLNDVTETGGSDQKIHSFSYNEMAIPVISNQAEVMSQAGIDHWGFYNGRQSSYNTRIPNLPILPPNLTGHIFIQGGISREPDNRYIGAGSLTRVNYPTGGYTSFEFDQNDYSTSGDGTAFSVIQYGSGLRVSKITQHDGINPDIVKTYSYRNGNGSSTGIISYLPQYSFTYGSPGNQDDAYNPYGAFTVTVSKNSVLFPIDIGYSSVAEQISDGGLTTYHYTTLLDYPYSDVSNTGITDAIETAFGSFFPSTKHFNFYNPFQAFKGRYSYMIGQLKEKDISNTNTAYKEEITYTLAPLELGFINANYTLDVPNDACWLSFSQNYMIASGVCQINSEQHTKSFADTETTSSSTSYTYDATSFQISSVTQDMSNGHKRKTYFTYPNNYTIDVNATLSDEVKGIQLLQNRNVINAVIEKTVYEFDESADKNTFIGASLTTYKKDVPLADRSLKYNTLSTVPFTATTITNGSLAIAGGYEEIQQNTYNAFGNLSYVKNRNDVPVSYLWDYHQSLITAKAANVALNETDETQASTINILGDANSTSLFGETEYPAPNGNVNVGTFTVGNNEYAILSGKISTSHPSSISYFILGLQDANGKIVGVPKYFMNDSGTEESYSLSYSLPPGTYTVFYYYKHSADARTSGLPSGLRFSLAVNLLKPHTQVYYNGFEADITSISTTDSKSGAQCHQGTFTIPMPYQAGSYILSYWQKPSGQTDWSRHEETLTITGSGTADKTIGTSDGLIDDVRISPVGALLTTNTFDPAFGPTSVTDPNHQVTYYEYDGFGRVSVIRDNNGKIVKSYVYEYKR